MLSSFSVGLAILVLSLLGSIVYDRFFCKYLCPMGAFLGAISRASLFKVRRNAATCTNCKACDKVCPVNVDVSTVEVVNDAECINCNECVNVCPVQETLTVSTGGVAKRALKPNTVLWITVAVIAAALGLTTLTGTFAWTMPSLAKTAEKAGGTINPEDIKGSMSFEEIAKVTGISGEAFREKFGVSEAEMTQPIKDLAGKYGFDVHTDVREFVAEKLGQNPNP